MRHSSVSPAPGRVRPAWPRAAAIAPLALSLAAACGGGHDGPPTSPLTPEFEAANAPAIWQGAPGRRNDHIGHTVVPPQPGFAGRAIIAAGGGNPWIEVPQAPATTHDIVAFFRANPVPGTGAVRPIAAVQGDEAGDRFGFALAFGPRLVSSQATPPDLAVGAPRGPWEEVGEFTERGVVHVVAGADLEARLGAGPEPIVATRMRVYGAIAGGRFGAALAALDLDGDGGADLIVGEPGGSLAPGFGGRVWRVPSAGLDRTLAAGLDRIRVDDPRLGATVLAEGEPGDSLGTSLAMLPADPARAVPAALLCGALGLSYDPAADRWIAAAAGSGHARIVHLDGAGAPTVSTRLEGGAPESHFGRAIAWAQVGGAPIALVGAPFDVGAEGLAVGSVHAFDRSGRRLWRIDGSQELARFGWSLAVNGPVLAVGAPNASRAGERFDEARTDPDGFRRGSLHLLRFDADPLAPPAPTARWHAEGARDHLGFSAAAAELGGQRGFLAGALAWPVHPGTEQGRVYLIPTEPMAR